MSSQETQRKRRKYVVVKRFQQYLPDKENFEIIEQLIPDLGRGDFIVKAEYISVDPYMRSFAVEKQTPYKQFGFQVGKVIESKNQEYPVGKYVVSHSGWCDFSVLNGEPDEMFHIKPYEPEIGKLPVSLAVGALGMPGITAYLGLLEICKPKKGDVVCVTSAAGAVGSLVGQIAKIKGCIVIGFTGTDEKVKVLKKDFGFHHAFNYKSEQNIKNCIMSVAPNGIDCYFDNVGGNLAKSIMECVKEFGRVALCGSISTYGEEHKHQKKSNTLVSVRLESFSFTQWDWSKQSDALQQLKDWIQKGTIKVRETVTNGFEKLPNAFVGMLKGENIGKALVKV